MRIRIMQVMQPVEECTAVTSSKTSRVFPLAVAQSDLSKRESIESCYLCMAVVQVAKHIYAEEPETCTCSRSDCNLLSFCSIECKQIFYNRVENAPVDIRVHPCQIKQIPSQVQLALLLMLTCHDNVFRRQYDNNEDERELKDLAASMEQVYRFSVSWDICSQALHLAQRNQVDITVRADFGEFALDFEGVAIYAENSVSLVQESGSACLI